MKFHIGRWGGVLCPACHVVAAGAGMALSGIKPRPDEHNAVASSGAFMESVGTAPVPRRPRPLPPAVRCLRHLAEQSRLLPGLRRKISHGLPLLRNKLQPGRFILQPLRIGLESR